MHPALGPPDPFVVNEEKPPWHLLEWRVARPAALLALNSRRRPEPRESRLHRGKPCVVDLKTVQLGRRYLIQHPLDVGDAVGRTRMVRDPCRRVASAPRRLLLSKKLLEERQHTPGADSRAHHVVEATLVGLYFVAAAHSREDRGTADVDGRLSEAALTRSRQRAKNTDPDICALRLLHLLHRVAPDNVLRLVSQNSGELGHAAGPLEHATIHINESAGERERVHDAGVYHLVLPLEIGA